MGIKNEAKLEEEKPNKGKIDIEYDDLLSTAGQLGRCQWLLFFSTCPFFAFGVCVYYSQMFMTEISPNHWCWIPELANMTDIQRRELGVPKSKEATFGYSQCEMYTVNWTEVLATGQKPDQSWATTACLHGWEFNRSEIPYPTVGSEFEWVCEKDSYQATAQAMFFFGAILGGLAFGWIADRFGRLTAIIGSCFIGFVGGLTSTFSRNFYEFVSARFVMGLSYDTSMAIAFLLILEYIAPKYRTLLANLSFAIFYCLFAVALPWIALYCGHWKTISLVTSLPLAFGMLSKLFLLESPMWLLSQGRVDEAVEKVQVIGRINRKEIPLELIVKFKQSMNNNRKQEHQNFSEIFRRPILRKVFILICLQNMCCTLIFDALVRNIGQLDFDFYVTFSVVSFTEFPSVLLCGFVMDPIGRRWLCIFFHALCCIFCLLTICAKGLPNVIFAVMARFAVNVSYSVSLIWGPEVLPTAVRGSGVAVIHICGFIIDFFSPYVVYLKVYFYWLPMVVIGTIAGLGMVIAFALLETAMRRMPQTFEEAERLTENQRLWTLPFLEARRANKVHLGETNL